MDFDVFVAAHGAGLVRFAYLLTRDLARAEDLVQDALVRSYRRWDRIAVVDQPLAYVRQIVVRGFLSWRRGLASREVIGVTGSDVAGPDPATGVADRHAMWQALAALPARQRTVLVLRYYEDLPDDQIADLVGCAPATVRSLTARGLARLRTTLAEHHPTEPTTEHAP